MRTLWNASLGHDFVVLLLIFPLCFFSLSFVGTRWSNSNALGRDCFIFLRTGVYDTFKLPLKWLDSMIMLFLEHFLYQGLPSTHLRLLWNWIFYQKYLGGQRSSKDTLKLAWYLSWCLETQAKLHLWELALLSRLTVIVHNEHDDPEHSKAPLRAASVDHRLVFLAKVSETFFFGSIWNMRFPNSQPPSLQICSHTLYILHSTNTLCPMWWVLKHGSCLESFV